MCAKKFRERSRTGDKVYIENTRKLFYTHMRDFSETFSRRRRRRKLDKPKCIYLRGRNVFNLADNSGVSMGNRQPRDKRGRRMRGAESSFSIFTSMPLHIHDRWLARETEYPRHNVIT